MIASFVLSVLLAVLGAAWLAPGIAIGVVDALRPKSTSLEFGVSDVIKTGELIREILKALEKLKPGAQFPATGCALLAAGIVLLSPRHL